MRILFLLSSALWLSSSSSFAGNAPTCTRLCTEEKCKNDPKLAQECQTHCDGLGGRYEAIKKICATHLKVAGGAGAGGGAAGAPPPPPPPGAPGGPGLKKGPPPPGGGAPAGPGGNPALQPPKAGTYGVDFIQKLKTDPRTSALFAGGAKDDLLNTVGNVINKDVPGTTQVTRSFPVRAAAKKFDPTLTDQQLDHIKKMAEEFLTNPPKNAAGPAAGPPPPVPPRPIKKEQIEKALTSVSVGALSAFGIAKADKIIPSTVAKAAADAWGNTPGDRGTKDRAAFKVVEQELIKQNLNNLAVKKFYQARISDVEKE